MIHSKEWTNYSSERTSYSLEWTGYSQERMSYSWERMSYSPEWTIPAKKRMSYSTERTTDSEERITRSPDGRSSERRPLHACRGTDWYGLLLIPVRLPTPLCPPLVGGEAEFALTPALSRGERGIFLGSHSRDWKSGNNRPPSGRQESGRFRSRLGSRSPFVPPW